jgi:FdhD protein
MKDALEKRTIWRVFASGEASRAEDELLLEKPCLLEVDGREEATVVLTPGEEDLWALGHLFCRRRILSRDDVASLEALPGKISLRRRVFRPGIPLRNRLITTASTGLVEREEVEGTGEALPVDWSVPFPAVASAVEALAEAPLFRRTGSTHVALLAHRQGKQLFCVEDIGRHNALDKAVGWAVREGIDLRHCFLALSGRLPADMVLKAVGASVPLLASVSAATGSGVDVAERAGITLIGFVRQGRMNVYTVPERITELARRG